MRKRNIFIIAAIVVLIPIVAFAWWLLSPLFLTNTVDEEFPFAASAEIPAGMTMTEVETVMETMAKMDQEPMAEPMPMSMPSDTGVIPEKAVLTEASPEMREAIEKAMAGDTSAIEKIMEEAANAGPPPEPVALASGSFRDADSFHRGSGSATIYLLPDGSHLLRLEDFEVTNGPDLRVLLATPNDPQSRTELQDGGYIHLAKLKGNIGNQNYEIPADIDLGNQNSVIIYCMPFHVIFSVASLEKVG
jgi:hypothetical protein